MEETHKHKGVLTSKGGLRSHAVSRKHKDRYASQCHNLALGAAKRTSKKVPQKIKAVKKILNLTKEKASFAIDEDGFVFIDVDEMEQKGVRIKFVKIEIIKNRMIKRTVGVEFKRQ